MKIKVLSAFFLLLILSCVDSDDYESQLAKMPKEFVSHFPSRIDSLSCSFVRNTDTTNKCIYLMLYEKNNDIGQYKIGKYLSKYAGSDTNLITVKRSSVTYWNPEKAVTYHSISANHIRLYPVPYFETEELHFNKEKILGVFSDKTKSGLSKDFTIFVYDYKQGSFWKGLKPLDYMPKEYKNGYSKGIAVNSTKGLIIYWMIIW